MPRSPARLALALGLAASGLATPLSAAEPAADKQLVLVSFDGAHDNALWEKSLALAGRTGARFTYFLSCTYLMDPAGKAAYQAPGEKKGRSATGFALGVPEVATRLDHLWQAHLSGHEIAGHACGHFDGKGWSVAEWRRELAAFRDTLSRAWAAGAVKDREPADWQRFVREDITGFRAPYLSPGPALVTALKAEGYRYDASLVTRGPALPVSEDGMLRFGLPLIPEGPKAKPVVAMDYNLFVRHSKAVERPEEAGAFEARTLAAFRAAFDRQYAGERIPLQLGFHFVEMNGGAYWAALSTFLAEVCGKPDVACVSYREAIPLIAARTDRAETVSHASN